LNALWPHDTLKSCWSLWAGRANNATLSSCGGELNDIFPKDGQAHIVERGSVEARQRLVIKRHGGGVDGAVREFEWSQHTTATIAI